MWRRKRVFRRRWRRRFRRNHRFRFRRSSYRRRPNKRASTSKFFTRLIYTQEWSTKYSHSWISPKFGDFRQFDRFAEWFTLCRLWKCVVKVIPLDRQLPWSSQTFTSQGTYAYTTQAGTHGIIPWFDDRSPWEKPVAYEDFLSYPNWKERSNLLPLSLSFRPKIPSTIPDSYVQTLNPKASYLVDRFPLLDCDNLREQRFFGALYGNSGTDTSEVSFHNAHIHYKFHIFIYITFYNFKYIRIEPGLSVKKEEKKKDDLSIIKKTGISFLNNNPSTTMITE